VKQSILPVRRNRNNGSVKYQVTDGRELVGVIFGTRGVYTSVSSSGYLVGAYPTLQAAARALPRAAVSS
jgi:hypothetical protein